MDDVINKSISWTEEEQSRYRKRFTEIYKSALHDNVQIEGKSPENGRKRKVGSPELEPVNVSRKRHLTMELMPELDEQVVAVARKRKTCPNQCARHLAKQCKYECLRMLTLKGRTPVTTLEPSSVEDISGKTKSSLETAARSCSRHMKSITALVEEARNTSAALHIYRTQLNTRTDNVVFESDNDITNTNRANTNRGCSSPPPKNITKNRPTIGTQNKTYAIVR
ncbi:hypothetical protein LSAT2_028891 [Lamellibrachia satsuma]|nr:hypothetical protein LSAT2_028891 [Lamellibrachia satsuma]